ncbi:MAG TPA: TonB-dependent receptor plug domain-containing protein, partial [Rhizomicrobium sp.]|nr:TonB-dependent receptor plug domain-containing protein [Rhizomicrobium sp.]
MPNQKYWKSILAGSTCLVLSSTAFAGEFSIAGGDLKDALNAYSVQSGLPLLVSTDAVKGIRSAGIRGDFSNDAALSRLLSGTGFVAQRRAGGTIAVVRGPEQSSALGTGLSDLQFAQASPPPPRAVETVTVTSSKLGGGDVQSIPISITALSQEQLTATQTAGGPDLIKQVPNMTFTKTNFSGYSIQLRGIGTQAISVTTDPAVAVSFNDVPFLRNHFFEQEFFDISQVQVLRGPQGTLYGRNATAGVVNITSARPTDQFEALASGEIGNYKQRRFEGMVNLPILDDRISLRVAGEWTKRNGYSFNELTDKDIDGRNLWSLRATLGWRPLPKLQTYLIWERFQENDDRLRSAKQLCKTAPYRSSVNGVPIPPVTGAGQFGNTFPPYLSQGCEGVSLYSDEAFQMPNGYTLPYYTGLSYNGLVTGINPYRDTEQSRDLRVIQSQIDPVYKAKSDIVMLNADYEFAPGLTLTSQTAFNHDFLYASQDYNRFASAPGVFLPNRGGRRAPGPEDGSLTDANGVFCDPQLGCSDRILAQDLVQQNSWQAGQEFRLASKFDGRFNFSVGGSYLHYETIENYYVFINAL